MIIDIHTHVPSHRDEVPPEEVEYNHAARPDRAVKITTTWEEHFQAMAPVDRAVVFGIAFEPMPSMRFAGSTVGYENPNDATYAYVNAHPEKLIGFMSVNPNAEDALEEMERCVGDLRLKGIKLGPIYQKFHPWDQKAQAIYGRAQELGLPIVFHQGTSFPREAPLKYAPPTLMDEVAQRFPDLKIVMAHMAHPWQIDCIVTIRKHPNLFADISGLFYRPWSFYNCLRLAYEWGVMHKLLLGSDFPFSTPQENLDALPRVNDILEGTRLPRVPEEGLAAIIQRDSLQLLGVEV